MKTEKDAYGIAPAATYTSTCGTRYSPPGTTWTPNTARSPPPAYKNGPHPETVIYDREGATWIRLNNGWAPTINPHHQIPWEDLYEQSPLMSETQWARFTARLRAAVPHAV